MRLRQNKTVKPHVAEQEDRAAGRVDLRSSSDVAVAGQGGGMAVSDLGSLSRAQRARVEVIYHEAFPARERMPFHDLVGSARRDERLILVMTDCADPVAFAVVSHLVSARCAFVEYFAVKANRRGGGIGQRLWAEMRRALKERGWPLRLVLEVEDPAEPGTPGDVVRQRHRRIRFWERVGVVLLADVGYVIPNYEAEGTVPMWLMWADASEVPGPPPNGERLHEVILALYFEGYGLAPDDPLVVRARDCPLWTPPRLTTGTPATR